MSPDLPAQENRPKTHNSLSETARFSARVSRSGHLGQGSKGSQSPPFWSKLLRGESSQSARRLFGNHGSAALRLAGTPSGSTRAPEPCAESQWCR